MGGATVYEWDLLFPDVLDIFVLSVLPISTRRLFFARVFALAIFLALVLAGTSLLGTVFYPFVSDQPKVGRLLLAHAIAVTMSGSFAAATFLALQGMLINIVGDRTFRRITPVLQGGSIMLLLAVLLLYPTLSRSLPSLLGAGIGAARYFPPFWFLGVYECVFRGASAPLGFGELARTGSIALAIMVGVAIVTYPLAYRRRVRQLVEGARASDRPRGTALPLVGLLHATVLREPSQRAVFHFIQQTVLRTSRQRVMLALYGGLAVSLALSNMLVLRAGGGHVRASLLPQGIRAAVPIMAFWTVIAAGSIVSSPVDRRGSWLFRAVIGRAGPGHIAGMWVWTTMWSLLVSLATVLLLHLASPAAMRTPLVACSVLLADVRIFFVRWMPFAHMRRSSVSDFPLMIVRYVVLFPLFVGLVIAAEGRIEASEAHLLGTVLLVAVTHLALRRLQAKYVVDSGLETVEDEELEEFPQRLGLRDG
jgi:hypothetical protein